MNWHDEVARILQTLPPVQIDDVFKRRCVNLIDLTRLNVNDTESGMAAFCQKANTPLGWVAGVCVYPEFIRLVADQFRDTPVQAVTVANFPGGDQPLALVLASISRALEAGATEIDLVFPYQAYLAGGRLEAQSFVATCKAAVGEGVVLKVILETGALADLPIIANAANDALLSGADFIKTSTGKIAAGATFAAVATMLLVVQSLQPELTQQAGVKVSGGIKTLAEAHQYMSLASAIMGDAWVNAKTFRIGASQLLDLLLKDAHSTD